MKRKHASSGRLLPLVIRFEPAPSTTRVNRLLNFNQNLPTFALKVIHYPLCLPYQAYNCTFLLYGINSSFRLHVRVSWVALTLVSVSRGTWSVLHLHLPLSCRPQHSLSSSSRPYTSSSYLFTSDMATVGRASS